MEINRSDPRTILGLTRWRGQGRIEGVKRVLFACLVACAGESQPLPDFKTLRVEFPSPSLPNADQNDALVGAYLAWCVHNRPSSIELVGVAPSIDEDGIREGFILHASRELGIDLPVAKGMAAPNAKNPEGGEESADDRSGDHARRLLLTDYGVVHGKEPENAWLVRGRDYTMETMPPHVRFRFQLVHSASFAGGLGWRAVPTVRKVLAWTGSPTPEHLSKTKAVVLRVVEVPNRLEFRHSHAARRASWRSLATFLRCRLSPGIAESRSSQISLRSAASMS